MQSDQYMLLVGDCRSVLSVLPDNSVDSVICDPPYELGFMNRGWDRNGVAYDSRVWAECLRALKPGGYLFAFGGTRTSHRMVCAIEDAGFAIRDQMVWIYGSGMPKGELWSAEKADRGDESSLRMIGAGFEGWARGGLKPAHEPICLARKPIIGNVETNVLKWGTGALNVDACRVHAFDAAGGAYRTKRFAPGATVDKTGHWKSDGCFEGHTQPGRWPANVIHDGSDVVLSAFPEASGQKGDVNGMEPSSSTRNVYNAAQRKAFQRRSGEASARRRYADRGATNFAALPGERRFDDGSAARFFYCAKASPTDRSEGLAPGERNLHPCVKPTDLMAHLCQLVTPPGGLVLDPFMGSGSTGKAAVREGFRFIGIDENPDYVAIARRRIEYAAEQVARVRDVA
ncbi:site-specific DNA-methyltransferase [Burkholderia contaminans]|uniref:DNA-methyltransferase n=1 Tax=Burkholderia contaminans TaxID=488447 RepID=UPI002D7FBFDD|nr:site-specific DNA-methyltransferase [Burkholderia contaminans]